MKYHDSMEWPANIVAAFHKALKLELKKGVTKEEAIQYMLDEAARRAVWRAEADPARLPGGYSWPYTPLGALTASGLDGRAITLTLYGDKWGKAVDLLYDYVRGNAELICTHFRDSQEPYDDMNIRP